MRTRTLGIATAAAAMAFFAAVLLDLSKVFSTLIIVPRLCIGALVTATSLGVRYLSPSLAYVVVITCLLTLHDPQQPMSRTRRLVADLAAILCCVAIFATLGAYAPFLKYQPAMVALSLHALGLCIAFRVATSSTPAWRLRGACSVLSVAAFIGITLIDRALYPKLYPTMHLAFMQMAMLCAFTSVSTLILPAARSWSPRAAWRLSATTACVVLLAVGTAAFAKVGRQASGLVRSVTALGQARVALGLSTLDFPGRKIALDTGPWAESYFVEHNGLPKLHEDFALRDFNVLLITIEALRYDFTSLADPKLQSTPNMLAFEEAGAYAFSRAYSPSSGTLHSMSSVQAMSFPSSLALRPAKRPWWGVLDEDENTVAELFRAAGRSTFWVSHDVKNVFTLGRIQGFEQGFEPKRVRLFSKDAIDNDRSIAQHGIEQVNALRGANKRFYGWIFLEAPHSPYYNHEGDSLAGDDASRYRSEIRFADVQLGRILDELRKTDALRDTIVIIAADHGEELLDHGGTHHKATVYSEVTHVPMLVWIPGQRGTRMNQPTSLTYVMPWLLRNDDDAVRAGARKRIEETLVPMMRATNDAVVSELIGHDRMNTTLVYPRYKLNYDLFADHAEVFDLERDPGEHTDLLLTDDRKAARLLKNLTGYLNVRRTLKRYKVTKKNPPEPERVLGAEHDVRAK